MAIYSATKAFTLCLAESLWGELHPAGVDVLTLIMGVTDTPGLRAMRTEKGQPMPPAMASCEEVAELGLTRLPYGPVCNWGLSKTTSQGMRPGRRRSVARAS